MGRRHLIAGIGAVALVAAGALWAVNAALDAKRDRLVQEHDRLQKEREELDRRFRDEMKDRHPPADAPADRR